MDKEIRTFSRQSAAENAIPFGIAQVGKAFRNEVIARQFVFRMREFEQMEMQYFVKPGTDDANYEEWLQKRLDWHKSLGIRQEKLRFMPHPEDKLAHYARAAADIQYEFPIGWQEVEGIHNRTDFDLSQHSEYSGKKLEYFDPQTQERFVPYVIETSIGLDRCIMMTLSDAYHEEEVNGEKRTVLKLHPKLAPVTVGIFPLIKKPELVEVALKLKNELSDHYKIEYDEKGSIGKRYRRLDEAGTPYCLTVDFDSLEDQCVTLRDRDSMEQKRINLSEVSGYLSKAIKEYVRV